MKRTVSVLLLFVMIFLLIGCEYYSDKNKNIEITLDDPTSNGFVKYKANVNDRKRTAKLSELVYYFDSIKDNKIIIIFPEVLEISRASNTILRVSALKIHNYFFQASH